MTHASSRRAPSAIIALALALSVVAAPAARAVGHSLSVIVMSATTGDAARAALDAGGSVEQTLPIVNGVVARVPADGVAGLSARATVVPNRVMHVQGASYDGELRSVFSDAIGASALRARGIDGEGVTIGLIDTGVADVPDLRGRVVAEANFASERGAADTFGHGTFEAGILVGNGASSAGRYTGVAPGAKIFSLKVAGADGSTSLGRVLAAVQLLDWSAERFNVRVAVLALSSGSPLPPGIDPLSLALRSLWAHGVTVVVAAGNDGPEPGSIGSPGEDPVLLTAGSVNDAQTPETGDDRVSGFSAVGPTRWGAAKPDIAAPGAHIVSLRAPGSTLDGAHPSARIGDAYFKGSGTSMSAAVTAGAAALLLAARPELSPDDVKALFEATAGDIVGGNAASAGAGELDVARAAAYGSLPKLDPMPEVGKTPRPWSPPGQDYEWRSVAGLYRWVSKKLDARRWDARSWDARSWDARSWDARSWDARSWDARSWDARSWDARSWDARSWDARSWDARSWDAHAWASAQWESRSWDSRSWDSRSWDSRSWDSRSWDSRSWDSRSWDSRTWDAASYD